MVKINGCPPGRVKLGNRCFSESSWLNELVIKYDKVTEGGDIKKIDKANDIILKAIDKLNRLK